MSQTKVVPIEPTEEMLEAAYAVDANDSMTAETLPNTYREVYKAMLAAAPAASDEPVAHEVIAELEWMADQRVAAEAALAEARKEIERLIIALIGKFSDVKVGDTIRVRYRGKQEWLNGVVAKIQPEHQQIQVESGWGCHTWDTLEMHIPAVSTPPTERP